MCKRTSKTLSILFSFLLILARISFAQWSTDPFQNLAIADTTGEQSIPKMAKTSDGGCFISWFDNRSGNYSVYLQRLNALGEAQFPSNGLLISDHPQQSWLTDSDMAVDGSDNAIIVFNDIRNGGISDWDIYAYKISSEGTFLWGSDGISLSNVTVADFEVAPKVTVTSADNVVVSWLKSASADSVAVQKISASGQRMWGDFGITLEPAAGARLSAPDLVAAENDSVIMIWKSSTGPVYAPTTKLYTQKYGPDGSKTWGTDGVLIYDLGHISAWTNPEIYTDSIGGAFYTWYDAPSLSEFNVWVQHIDAHGNLVFPLNGVEASTNNTRLHLYPALSYFPQTDELFVFWIEENTNQNQYGVYGQKFSPQGNRLWTDDGKQFMALGGNTITFLNSAPADTSIYLGYFESSAPGAFDAAVKSFLIDRNGASVWSPVLLSSASLGNKDDLLMTVNTQSRAFLCWTDYRSPNFDIFAQNVNLDGTLGNPLVGISKAEQSIPADFVLFQNYPNPFNPTTTIEFSLLHAQFVTLGIYDILGQEITTLVSAKLPAGKYKYDWNSGERVSGVYFYRLEIDGYSKSLKMILLK
jgi:hypothetical protein